MMAEGSRATMPAKMISEMPLPMPRSVIISPSHMMKAVPRVRVSTVISRKAQPGCRTTGMDPPPPVMDSRPTAIPRPWTAAMTTRAVAGVLLDLFLARLRLPYKAFPAPG